MNQQVEIQNLAFKSPFKKRGLHTTGAPVTNRSGLPVDSVESCNVLLRDVVQQAGGEEVGGRVRPCADEHARRREQLPDL